MSSLWLALVFFIAMSLAAVVYWQLIVAEGAYLGPWVVAWTYDWVARRYDAIKRFDPSAESWFVAGPLLKGLSALKNPLVLDVATGTGRLPLALLRNHFSGKIIGLDLSRGMLSQAHAKLRLYGDRVHLVWENASHLPFPDGAFDAVTCLESLEFLPAPRQALAEMIRVLAPGGLLFLTNRVGREARLLPGRTMPRATLREVLAAHPLHGIGIHPWQVNYDLVMARKEGVVNLHRRGDIDLASLLLCPTCSRGLQRGAAGLSCPTCGQTYPVRSGMVHLAGARKRSRA